MSGTTLTEKQLANKLDHDGIYIHYGIIQGATSNDADCQVIIGDLFYGKHQFKDAIDWYRLAADKNDAKGQYKMGKMYQKGGGVAIDYKLAMDWYLKAAAQNNSKATKAIGGLFENGLGVPVDSARANEWYNKGSKTLWFKRDKNGLVKDAQQFLKMEQENLKVVHDELKHKVQKIVSLENTLSGYPYPSWPSLRVKPKEFCFSPLVLLKFQHLLFIYFYRVSNTTFVYLLRYKQQQKRRISTTWPILDERSGRPDFFTFFLSSEKQDANEQHSSYLYKTAKQLQHNLLAPVHTKMLVRNFIEDSLYNPNYGFRSKQSLGLWMIVLGMMHFCYCPRRKAVCATLDISNIA